MENKQFEEFKRAALRALGEEPEVWTDDDEFAKGERSMWRSCVATIKALELPQKEESNPLPVVSPKELAQKLDGWEYGKNFGGLGKLAAENGLLIVWGYSDDAIEFSGAIYDEVGCFDGAVIYFDKNLKHISFEPECGLNNSIAAIWCGQIKGKPMGIVRDFITEDGEQIPWTYKTDIPHETFMMYDEGEPYCRGMVFNIKDLV